MDTEERSKTRNVDEDNYLMALDKFTEPQAITKSDFLRYYPDAVNWHNDKVRSGDWTIYRRDGKEMWLNPSFVPHKFDCDSMHAGSPTRFMNHSCEPNCRLFTVSYNHSDTHIYELAFFTIEEVPANTELTFDYKDEDDRSIISDAEALEVKHRDGYMPQKCLCGTKSCRRYFFN